VGGGGHQQRQHVLPPRREPHRGPPAEAAAAFYWAARLQPGWADPLYGRRVALLMTDPDRLVRYMEDNRGTIRSPEIQAIDSLQLRALSLDPFLVQTFDGRCCGCT
jgi:hypothetical protein